MGPWWWSRGDRRRCCRDNRCWGGVVEVLPWLQVSEGCRDVTAVGGSWMRQCGRGAWWQRDTVAWLQQWHRGRGQRQDPAGTLCPQVRHEVSGQETHQDEAGRDPGPQRTHHAVPCQHRGEGTQAGLAPQLTARGRVSPGAPPARRDPISPARTVPSSSACPMPSTHPTSSASSLTS